MANYCSLLPNKGKQQFNKFKKELGYNKAYDILLIATNSKFLKKYKDTLSLDAEGIPSYESLLENEVIQEYIGNDKLRSILDKKYSKRENTIEDFNSLLELANTINKSHSYKRMVAVVRPDNNDKLQLYFADKTENNIKYFNNQYATFKLNRKISDIFNSLGIKVGDLEDIEIKSGRVGSINFDNAKLVAGEFINLINIANNNEGVKALSEEFSHLMVRVLKDKTPLIDRCINSLKNNPEAIQSILGKEYEDVIKFHDNNMELVAEEALGQLLQKALIENEELNQVKDPSLFSRLITYIKNLFKKFKANDVQKAIIDADNTINSLAKDIIKGAFDVTKDDISKTKKKLIFNSLSERIEKNIDILKRASEVEVKRTRIKKDLDKKTMKAFIQEIQSYSNPKADTIEGILMYAKSALNNLEHLNTSYSSLDNKTNSEVFSLLKDTRTYIQSYALFIDDLNNLISDTENNKEYEELFTSENMKEDISSIIKDLSYLSNKLTTKYKNIAIKSFSEFLSSYVGEELTIKGETIKVKDIIEHANSDISFFDRWLDSMGDSSDPLLQIIDLVVKQKKDDVRKQTIEDVKEIQNFFLNLEKQGIKDFEWIFEKDSEGNKTGNYISDVNYGQFDKDFENFMKQLKEKYGENPKGEDADNYIKERKEWLNTHGVYHRGEKRWKADPSVYKNEDFFNLSQDYKMALQGILQFKAKYDELYEGEYNPDGGNVDMITAIQFRKTGSQRIFDSFKSNSSIIKELNNQMQESLMYKEDDDRIFGERTKPSITDFEGNEYFTLPKLYQRKLKNPNELSTDIMATLMNYAYSARYYEGMYKIIEPLEVGKVIINEYRHPTETVGNTPLVERFNSLGFKVENYTKKNKSNIADRYNDYLESQVYLRYIKDEGSFTLFGKEISVSKATNTLLKWSSLSQLGFNLLANTANVATGVCMQNIEAMAGEFFDAKELFKADGIYTKELKDYLLEIGDRVKSSKLALFMEKFDIKQEYTVDLKHSQKKSILERLFGSNIAFIGQEGGDHWLYNRTAIAMALRTKVIVPGKGTMSLWDAMEIVQVGDNEKVKKIIIPEGTTLENGKLFDDRKFSRQIAHVNQHLFGMYNDDDLNAANRVSMGRLLMQYRKWMKPQFNKRFQAKQYNALFDKEDEGYYRTLFRIANELRRGQIQFSTMTEYFKTHKAEKENCFRAITELAQFFAVLVLTRLVDWDDDKDRPWALKLAEYTARRLEHELGGLAATPYMVTESLKTLQTPMASLSTIKSTWNLVESLITPSDYMDELQSGPYKGMSTLEKNFLKAPIPGITHYRQMDRFLQDIDTSISFYLKK